MRRAPLPAHRPDRAALRPDHRGATIAEFAVVFPVLCMMLMFLFDTGYFLFAKAILEGEVHATGRLSTLESATDASRATQDENVRTAVKRLVRNGTIDFTRTAYLTYAQAQAKAETYVDSNNDGHCNNGEAFSDNNRNGTRDLDSGINGGGGAKDVVVYTATLQYDRIFPVATLLGWSPHVTMSSSTLLRNQPFDKQAEAIVGHCA